MTFYFFWVASDVKGIFTFFDPPFCIFLMLSLLLGVYLKFIVHIKYFHLLSNEWTLYNKSCNFSNVQMLSSVLCPDPAKSSSSQRFGHQPPSSHCLWFHFRSVVRAPAFLQPCITFIHNKYSEYYLLLGQGMAGYAYRSAAACTNHGLLTHARK